MVVYRVFLQNLVSGSTELILMRIQEKSCTSIQTVLVPELIITDYIGNKISAMYYYIFIKYTL